jgi:tetratricopeptide (TPR) repeat protein
MTSRLTTALALAIALGVAMPAAAQSARAVGTVKGLDGRPIKGATVRAVNPDAIPSEIASATDDKGRFAMIGLRSGTWKFIAEAPGYLTVEATSVARVANNPPLNFAMARDPGPIPNALALDVQQQVAAANALRDEGRYDQALAAYQDIRAKNPKLSYINLVIAGLYRQRAAAETNPAARKALLDLAIGAYDELLKADAGNERAVAALATTRAEAAVSR